MDYDVKGNIQKLFDDGGLQDILLSVEEYFDNMDLYVFSGWIDGEVVEGPIVSKYWVEVTLKFDRDKVPDPRGTYLFHNQGTDIQVRKTTELVPREVHTDEDLDPATGKQVMDEMEVVLIKFKIPRRLVDAESVTEYSLLDEIDEQTEEAPEQFEVEPVEGEEAEAAGMEDEELR